jgi:biopolymer transport protein ExbD
MGSKNIEIPRINVVPILDAVFIFIFFLLMNTQIGEYFQITTSKPIVKSVSASQMEELKGKFFKVRVSNDKIVFTEGAKENVLKEFTWSSEDLIALHEFAKIQKEKNPKEKSIVVKSKSDVKYKELVKVVDAVQKKVETTEAVGGKVVLKPLYENLAFEKMR